MTRDVPSQDLTNVAVIIPALNEAESLALLLPLLEPLGLGQILVCDNGSTDGTRSATESGGATWVYIPHRGYGAACFAGMQNLDSDIRVVAFMDADLSDDTTRLPELVGSILDGRSDMVLGDRSPELRKSGSTTGPQRFANWLFPALIKLGWGHTYVDLGPFRAIRRTSLEAMEMRDRAFGWTMEMQVKAVEMHLRIHGLAVAYSKRQVGKSKISGTVRGVWLAAYWITRTCVGLWLTKRQRRYKLAPL